MTVPVPRSEIGAAVVGVTQQAGLSKQPILRVVAEEHRAYTLLDLLSLHELGLDHLPFTDTGDTDRSALGARIAARTLIGFSCTDQDAHIASATSQPL